MSSAIPIDIYHNNSQASQFQSSNGQSQRFRRESIAHSAGMGGVSWGGMSVGSWIRDEVMLNMNMPTTQMSMSPINSSSYLPNLEADFCRDYSCCGQMLPTLHDLLRHYEESHISPSPPVDPPVQLRRMQSIEAVSTNEVFLSPSSSTASSNNHHNHHHGHVTSSAAAAAAASGGVHAPHNAHMHPHANIPNTPATTASNTATNSSAASSGHTTPSNAMMVDDDDNEMCIDDPARHLYVIERGEHKPFKCNVIGCDKTYKNQNGLKYHRLHGHQNQTLHLNDDGTYSVIDPLSNTPYPDGMGFEQDKPYRCEVCGKRYKNLNGLKYHRGHSTH